MDQLNPKKVICPSCNGNGYVKLPEQLQQERVAQCVSCNSNGEIDEDKIDSMYVDADGLHRLQ